MEMDWPCSQNGEQLSLPDSNVMGTRRQKESGPPKNNMEAYNRERKKTVRMGVLEPSQPIARNRVDWREFTSLMDHPARRG